MQSMQSAGGRLAVSVAVLVSAILLAASPELRAAEEGDCGDNDGPVCWENQTCTGFLWWMHCSEEYMYFSSSDGDDFSDDDDEWSHHSPDYLFGPYPLW